MVGLPIIKVEEVIQREEQSLRRKEEKKKIYTEANKALQVLDIVSIQLNLGSVKNKFGPHS